MARKGKGRGKAVNRRKPSPGGRKPLVALLLVVALILVAFFLLERFRGQAPTPQTSQTPQLPQTPQKTGTKTESIKRLPLPARPAPQQSISSATVPAAKPAPRPKGTGHVAIIIDDMGSSMQQLQALLSINLPLTFAVIPSLAHAKGVSEGAHRAGAEVIVHMPMEPEGYPKQPLEKIGLLLNMENAEIQARVNRYFSSVPFAVGANNHMGSRFTQNAEKMDVVLKVLKEKGVFFVDSKTSPTSVGYRRARALGLKCGVRQVFLDNVQEEAAIAKQLEEVVAVARRNGSAIAICHPHPSTIRTLQSKMPELARNGITFVYASKLVQ